MGSRLLPAALLLTTGSLTAGPLRNLNTIEYEYRDQTLSSRNPRLERPDHLNILNGRSLFLYEQSKLMAQGEMGASTGTSGTTSFTALQARTAASLRQAHSSDTLELGWLRTHGADATQKPLEEVITEDGAPFTSTRAGYHHTRQIDGKNSINAAAGVSRNLDGNTDLESRSVGVSWAYLLDKNWTNTLYLDRGTQKVKEGISSSTWQLRNEDLWILGSDWTAQTTLGGLQQDVDSSKKTSFTAGAALAYTIRKSSPDGKKNQPQEIVANKINRPELDRIENIRTQSQFRAGWLRNLDQRRKGDSQFLADQFFVQGLWMIDPEQNLQIDLQRSQSVDKTVPGASGLISNVANLDYRWNHNLGPVTSGLIGSFGLGVTQETVKQNPLLYDRQQLRISYAVTF